jgi:hypothetical protein
MAGEITQPPTSLQACAPLGVEPGEEPCHLNADRSPLRCYPWVSFTPVISADLHGTGVAKRSRMNRSSVIAATTCLLALLACKSEKGSAPNTVASAPSTSARAEETPAAPVVLVVPAHDAKLESEKESWFYEKNITATVGGAVFQHPNRCTVKKLSVVDGLDIGCWRRSVALCTYAQRDLLTKAGWTIVKEGGKDAHSYKFLAEKAGKQVAVDIDPLSSTASHSCKMMVFAGDKK